MLMRLALAAALCFCLLVGVEEEYPEGVESDEEAEEEEEGDGDGKKPRKSLARPRRLSELSTKTTIHPLPEGSAFFLFSNTNRYARRSAC
jgi:voltage-dependent calcium channel L type alpha-1D